jgi:hypothetical protein
MWAMGAIQKGSLPGIGGLWSAGVGQFKKIFSKEGIKDVQSLWLPTL